MKVLVTGHLGFVGRHLTAELDRRNVKWVGIDPKLAGHFVEHDICSCPLPDDIDKVFHLAAQTDAQCDHAEMDAGTNIMGTLRVLEHYGSKVVHASSSMVNYPTTPYAISKLAAEHYARLFGAGVVRFPNLYGPGGHSVIDRFREQPTCTIYGSGDQLRTYQSVTVAVTALLKCPPGHLEILGGEQFTVKQIAMMTGKPVEFLPARENDLINATQLS